MAVSIDLSGQSAVVFGVANHRSIAWAIAQRFHEAGASLTVTYQNERMGRTVLDLVKDMDNTQAVECDVLDEASVAAAFDAATSRAPLAAVAHCVAFANKDDLAGDFSATGIDGFRLAMDVSAYSLLPVARLGAERMTDGGSIMTLTFHAADKVYPGYNIMGVAKAALENEVKQLASEFGQRNIRVNAISAGPLNTLAARGISGFTDMQKIHADHSPMRRNITQDEVGDAALFLASPLSTGITGTILYVDAGYNIMAV
ncbi:MAG: SDR family oxidoreductase [Chloroflexi bacterium]|nr:SDR family oxidoreductase [Chloroflexota bacterium]MDA1173791.1 SDR family oxidoreductase [Chloroflexota bacterium]